MAGADDLDIDARFLLANERTLLAWVRTALTFLAAGVATVQLLDQSWRIVPGVTLLLLGAVASAVGLGRYRLADRDIRRGQLPSPGLGPVLLATAVGVVGVMLVLLIVVT